MNTKIHRYFGCPPIPPDVRSTLDGALLEFIDYRKTGLSLNHVIGCPLGCAYCVRHLFGAFDFTRPQRLVDDAEAVDALIKHRFFREHITPLQLFNRATDPFLPRVKDHTFNVLRLLDKHGLKNHIAVITRHHVTDDDCRFLNTLQNLRLTLFVTYSGISDPRIEPVDSGVAERSLKTAFENARRYRVILYWRPIMPGVNDSPDHVRAVSDLSRFAHATAYTGVFFREEMDRHFRENGIPSPFNQTARRKVLPKETEAQVLRHFGGHGLFRKSSCAACFAHGIPDYNGHYGIQELCDGCPPDQKERCRLAYTRPDRETIDRLAESAGLTPYDIEIGPNAVRLSGLDEQGRYYLQHNTNFQVHDRRYEHKIGGTAEQRLGGAMTARLKGGEPLSPGAVFAIDLEGDGNSPPAPIDLALAEIRDWEMIHGWRRWLFKPERRITRMATSIHGIRNKDVEGAPSFESSAQEIRSLVSGATVVGHNVRVDIDVLGRMLPGWQPDRAIDTLKLAKLVLPGRASYGLQSLAQDYYLAEGLEEQCDSSAHTSAYDALLAARLLFRLLELRPAKDREYLLSSASIIKEQRQGSLF